MAYEILSIGDAEMLYSAFNGVAMIFGGGNMSKLIASGFIVGLLMVSIRYMTENDYSLRPILFSLIMHLVMFGPTGTVVIEDVYTGEVRTVANVPLGLAVPMSVISTIGVKLTTVFETAFSIPQEASMLQHGYLDSLNTLIKLRNIGTGTSGSDNTLNGDLSKTINAYIENCVMFDLELEGSTHEVTREGMEKSGDLWDSMKTTFINIDIMVYLPSKPEGEQKSCKDAYTLINNYLTGDNFVDQMDRYVSGLLQIKDASIRAAEKVDAAAAALSLAGFDSQIYMRNALLSSYLKDGPSAFIKRTGQEQLNLQWTGEQSMFNEIARPLMAFVEMFSVAMSPIVAFLSTLGAIGWSMMARYFQMMIWISLWGPVMSVCNLYIAIVTTRALEVAATQAEANGSGLQAMVMHDQLYQTLEIWLSAGGMLASSVPALSLMLVYGGSNAATSLSEKMSSGVSGSVKPGRLMPDPVSIESPMKLGSMTEYSPNAGAKKSGMADTIFSTSSTFERASQSAKSSLKSANDTVAQTISNTNQSTQRSGTMNSDVTSTMSSLTNASASGSSWSNGQMRTTGSGLSLTSAESEAVEAGINAGASLVLGSDMIGLSAKANLMSKTGASEARGQQISDAVSNAWSKTQSGSNVTTASSGSSNVSSSQSFSGTEESRAQAEQFSKQLQTAQTASENYSQTASLQDSTGKSLSMPYQDFGKRLHDSGAIVDINNANDELKKQMGAEKYQQLSDNANHEINNSSAQELPELSNERNALLGFLKLDQQNPVKAAEILNKTLTPSSSGSGVGMKPSEFKNNSQSVGDIVNPELADSFRTKAQGIGDGHGKGSNEDHGEDGSVGKQLVPEHQNQGQKSSTSPHKSAQNEVTEALKGSDIGNPDNIRHQIESGGRLDDNKDLSNMMGRAIHNEGHLAYDNVVKPLGPENRGAVSDTINDLTEKHLGWKPAKTPRKDNTSDNDLPPTPKD